MTRREPWSNITMMVDNLPCILPGPSFGFVTATNPLGFVCFPGPIWGRSGSTWWLRRTSYLIFGGVRTRANRRAIVGRFSVLVEQSRRLPLFALNNSGSSLSWQGSRHAPGTWGCSVSAWRTSGRSCTASVRSFSVEHNHGIYIFYIYEQ